MQLFVNMSIYIDNNSIINGTDDGVLQLTCNISSRDEIYSLFDLN